MHYYAGIFDNSTTQKVLLVDFLFLSRSCPECRVQSDFVCPSRYWCETKEEKVQLIDDYKKALRYIDID